MKLSKHRLNLLIISVLLFSCKPNNPSEIKDEKTTVFDNDTDWKKYNLDRFLPGLQISLPKDYKVDYSYEMVSISKNYYQKLIIQKGKISLALKKYQALNDPSYLNTNILLDSTNELIYQGRIDKIISKGNKAICDDFFYFSNIKVGEYQLYAMSDNILNYQCDEFGNLVNLYSYSKQEMNVFSKIIKTLKFDTSSRQKEIITEKELKINPSADNCELKKLVKFNDKLNVCVPHSAEIAIYEDEVVIYLSSKKWMSIEKYYTSMESQLKILNDLAIDAKKSHLKTYHIKNNELIYSIWSDIDTIEYYGVYAFKDINGEPYSINTRGNTPRTPLKRSDRFSLEECKNILSMFRKVN